jgi:hypothetical protein
MDISMYGLLVEGSWADSFDISSRSYGGFELGERVSYDVGWRLRIASAFSRPRALGARNEYAIGFSDCGGYFKMYSSISAESAIYEGHQYMLELLEVLEPSYLRYPFWRNERPSFDVTKTRFCQSLD